MISPQHLRLYPTPPRKPRIFGGLPDGSVGAAVNYAYTLWGLGSLTTSIVSGSLPPGLVLGSDGVVTGIPTTMGNYSWRVRVMQGNLLYADLDDDAEIDAGLWLAGPVALNGAAGGSENYYQKTRDINDWSAAPVPLPLGRTALQGISVAKQVAFMMFTGQNAIVSFDGAEGWQACNVVLPAVPVYWNGSVFVCGSYLSITGLNWSLIPNLSGTPAYVVAREYDGAIIVAYNDAPEPRFEYTLDNGATWTVVPASLVHDEAIYSLIVMPDMERINFGIASPSTPNIIQYFSDDLFVTVVGSGENRYHGKYGCSRMLVKGYPDTLELTTDGGWSWTTKFATHTVNSNFNFLDFGHNVWASPHRTSVDTPQTHSVRYSQDGGEIWSTGPTLYGSVNSIAFIGRRGDCSIYPAPGYSIFTNALIFGGDPTSVAYKAHRQWGSTVVRPSRDGQFVLNASTTTDAVISVHRRLANSLGFEPIPGVFGTYLGRNGDFDVSFDSQYFVIGRSGTSSFVCMRHVAGVFTELVTPGTPNVFGRPYFHPSRQLMLWGWDTAIKAYTLSGDTITEGALVGTGAWYAMDFAFSPTDPDIVLVRTNVDVLQIHDISDPENSLPLLAQVGANIDNSGGYGIYFSADGSHVLTVSGSSLHTRTWDKITNTLGPPVLLMTFPSRVLSSAMSKDHRYLAEGGDLAAPFLSIHHLSADGTQVLSSYAPPGSNITASHHVSWVDF